jgi:hypothetical protein
MYLAAESGSARARRAAAESPRLTASRARTSLEGMSPEIAWSSVSAVLSAASPVNRPIAALAPVWTKCLRLSGTAILPASAALCQIWRNDAAGAPAAEYSSLNMPRLHDSPFGSPVAQWGS